MFEIMEIIRKYKMVDDEQYGFLYRLWYTRRMWESFMEYQDRASINLSWDSVIKNIKEYKKDNGRIYFYLDSTETLLAFYSFFKTGEFDSKNTAIGFNTIYDVLYLYEIAIKTKDKELQSIIISECRRTLDKVMSWESTALYPPCYFLWYLGTIMEIDIGEYYNQKNPYWITEKLNRFYRKYGIPGIVEEI